MWRGLELLWLIPSLALGDASRVVERPRLRLGDVVPGAPAGLLDVDLGPAPPPGATRIIGRDEVKERVRDAGYEVSDLKIPAAIRLVGAARRLSAEQLDALCAAELPKVLPRGVSLVKAEAQREIVVSPGAVPRAAKMPRPPRRKGTFRTAATLEFESDGEVVARVLVPVTLEVGEKAAEPDLARGRTVNVVLEKRGVRVSAPGVAQVDADVGDVLRVRIAPTGRLVAAELVSSDEARVVESP